MTREEALHSLGCHGAVPWFPGAPFGRTQYGKVLEVIHGGMYIKIQRSYGPDIWIESRHFTPHHRDQERIRQRMP